MNSRHHALHAGLLAIAIALVAPPPTHPLVLAGVVLVFGVGIDLDHFLIARCNRGNWDNLRRVLREPQLVLFDQTAIFDTLDVWGEDRLFSHALIAGFWVSVAWFVATPYWASVGAVAFYVHILADLYDGFKRKETRAIEVTRALTTDIESTTISQLQR